jgi:hypothetical protein
MLFGQRRSQTSKAACRSSGATRDMSTKVEHSATERKYHVSGRNEDGDVWTFSTDDLERAEDMLSQMREDLDGVKLARPNAG